MKSVLISTKPIWCELTANRKKTVEIRKTKPKIDTPFKVYIYATEPRYKRDFGLCLDDGKFGLIYKWNYDYARIHKIPILSGKVIGEFVCDEIFPIRVFENGSIQDYMHHRMERSCVPYDDISNYIGKGKTGFGWHISDLIIYDKPRELSEFATVCEGLKPYQCDKCEYSYTESNESIGVYHECCCNNLKPLKRPPQSWCYAETKGENK